MRVSNDNNKQVPANRRLTQGMSSRLVAAAVM